MTPQVLRSPRAARPDHPPHRTAPTRPEQGGGGHYAVSESGRPLGGARDPQEVTTVVFRRITP